MTSQLPAAPKFFETGLEMNAEQSFFNLVLEDSYSEDNPNLGYNQSETFNCNPGWFNLNRFRKDLSLYGWMLRS